MSTSCFPRNWRRLRSSPSALGSVKFGASSPTSRALAIPALIRMPANSMPTSNSLLVDCIRLSMASLLLMTGHHRHTALAHHTGMIPYVCSPAPPAASADKPIDPIQHLWRDREPQSFCHLQIKGELDLCVHLHWDLSRLRPLENLVHQARCLPTRGVRARTV